MLAGKYAGMFVSTGTPGGGQEATVMNSLSTLTQHGIIYVPLGYAHAYAQLTNITEVHGGEDNILIFSLNTLNNLLFAFLPGSPWGAGTYSAGDGSRQPSPLELETAEIQGKAFHNILSRVKF